ncbi:Outer membrane protein assembly factor BamB [ANME-1 cluster archaeon GoMg3.2]|nr:Outer membrane protein assembly factor BamB [ANME-1 cluster archaeon GoMg3.2]
MKIGGDEKMKRQFVMATVMMAIMLLSVLMVLPVMLGLRFYEEMVSGLYCDINGDSANDVLLSVTTISRSGKSITTIRAVDGCNGEDLWKERKYPNCWGDAQPAGDLNGDNKSDAVIVLSSCKEPISGKSYGEVIGVNGCDGTELWSIHYVGDIDEWVGMSATPANLTSASRTDVIVNIETETLYGDRTIIMAINGRDGSVLWEKSVTTSVVGVPVDLNNDGKDEVVLGMSEEMAESHYFINRATNVTVVNGNKGEEIWSKEYSEVVTFEPAGDLTGDGANDLTVWIGCCKLEAFRGSNGEKLWAYEIR